MVLKVKIITQNLQRKVVLAAKVQIVRLYHFSKPYKKGKEETAMMREIRTTPLVAIAAAAKEKTKALKKKLK